MKPISFDVLYVALFAFSSISCSSLTSSLPFSESEISVETQSNKAKINDFYKQDRDLNSYVQSLTHELVSNMNHVKPRSVLATSSFVYVDGDFLSMPIFAKQIQESFTYEFHKMGQPIIEFKTTGYIRVTPEGDFALSKDFTELRSTQSIDYILVGTLTEFVNGIQVNAKLVGAKSHAVVAASQIMIPRKVIDSIIPSTNKGQTIKLTNN
jgi:TolB-like protein